MLGSIKEVMPNVKEPLILAIETATRSGSIAPSRGTEILSSAEGNAAESHSIMGFSITRMTEHDLLEVVEIEELSGLSPWGWDAYHKELQSPEDVIMLIARVGGIDAKLNEGRGIAGFIIARLVSDEMHVNNVAVRTEFRRHGLAAQLLQTVLECGRCAGARMAFLEVRAGNKAAQELYHRCGFEAAGRRRRYYSNPVEDALLMSVSL